MILRRYAFTTQEEMESLTSEATGVNRVLTIGFKVYEEIDAFGATTDVPMSGYNTDIIWTEDVDASLDTYLVWVQTPDHFVSVGLEEEYQTAREAQL